MRRVVLILFICILSHFNMALASVAKQLSNNLTSHAISQTRSVVRNYLSLELGGRGAVYSLNYDRRMTPNMNLGLGFSHYSMEMNPSLLDSEISVTILPIYANYYFTRGSWNPYFTSGVSIVHLKAYANIDVSDALSQITLKYTDPNTEKVSTLSAEPEIKSNNSTEVVLPLPHVGTGIEFRNSGSILRLQGLVYYIDKIYPWLGFSIGGGF